MKITFKLGILFLAIALVACKKDPLQEPTTDPKPKPPTATFDGFEVVDSKIVSPKWLADIVEYYDDWGATAYLFRYEGEDCIYIINWASSYSFTADMFFSLTGENLIDASYPATKEDYELLFAMKKAAKDAVLLWPSYGDESASTRVDWEVIEQLPLPI